MSSPIFENLQMPLEVPALTAGAKCKKSKSGQRRVKNRDTGKCRLPCPSYCRPPLSDEEKDQRKQEKIKKQLEENRQQYGELVQDFANAGGQLKNGENGAGASGASASGSGAGGNPPNGGYYRIRGGEIEGGEFEGGEFEGGAKSKRKMTKYNMFVKKYAASHRNMSGKSLIKSAAKSWNKCKRSRSCSPRRR